MTYARAGVMPAWGGRLDPITVKQLAVYVHTLGGGEKKELRLYRSALKRRGGNFPGVFAVTLTIRRHDRVLPGQEDRMLSQAALENIDESRAEGVVQEYPVVRPIFCFG